MRNDKKIINKPFIITSVLAIFLVLFFVIHIITEKERIIKSGKNFEAKCIEVYTKKGNNGSKLNNHNKLIKVYVFEVISPSEIKGEKFEKTKRGYRVGITYKGKYIDNGKNYNKIMNSRYEYQIIE